MQVSWAWSRWASPLHVRAGGRSRRPRRRELASSQRAVRRRWPPPTSGGKSSGRRRRRRPTGSRSVLQEPERSSLQQAAVEPQTAGLASLRVEYDDGSAGTLTISCRISNAEPGRFEGVTASKGFVDFWNRVRSPTLFHVLN